MSERLKELETLRDQASRRFFAAESTYRGRIRELEQEARATTDKEPVGVEFYAAQDALRGISTEWLKLKDAESVQTSVDRLPFPEGTMLVEWQSPPYYAGRDPGQWRPTNKTGKLEVIRPGAKLPAGQRYGMDPGTIVVRMLKKDGGPSSRVERFGANWIPQGQKHPKAAT